MWLTSGYTYSSAESLIPSHDPRSSAEGAERNRNGEYCAQDDLFPVPVSEGVFIRRRYGKTLVEGPAPGGLAHLSAEDACRKLIAESPADGPESAALERLLQSLPISCPDEIESILEGEYYILFI